MLIRDQIRKLAKSTYYLMLYSHIKDLNLDLFDNNKNLSFLQLSFLSYLRFYGQIHEDISADYVSEYVLKDFIYEDSYVLYKSKKGSDFYKNNNHKIQNTTDDKVHRSWGIKFK